MGDLLAVALYLQLRCGNGALILCDLGAGNRILLLIGVGLELFLDQFLRDAPGLCGQAPDLIGPRPGRSVGSVPGAWPTAEAGQAPGTTPCLAEGLARRRRGALQLVQEVAASLSITCEFRPEAVHAGQLGVQLLGE